MLHSAAQPLVGGPVARTPVHLSRATSCTCASCHRYLFRLLSLPVAEPFRPFPLLSAPPSPFSLGSGVVACSLLYYSRSSYAAMNSLSI